MATIVAWYIKNYFNKFDFGASTVYFFISSVCTCQASHLSYSMHTIKVKSPSSMIKDLLLASPSMPGKINQDIIGSNWHSYGL